MIACLLIHSAGVGRTGSFIGFDNFITESDHQVDIYSCVLKMRQQRVDMVQTCVSGIMAFITVPKWAELIWNHMDLWVPFAVCSKCSVRFWSTAIHNQKNNKSRHYILGCLYSACTAVQGEQTKFQPGLVIMWQPRRLFHSLHVI